jgi:hypothetical protein
LVFIFYFKTFIKNKVTTQVVQEFVKTKNNL